MRNTQPLFVLDFGSAKKLLPNSLDYDKLRSVILVGSKGVATLDSIVDVGTADFTGYSDFVVLDKSSLEFFQVMSFASGDGSLEYEAEVHLQVQISDPVEFLQTYDESAFLGLALAEAKGVMASRMSLFWEQTQAELNELEANIQRSRPSFLGVRLLSHQIRIIGRHPTIESLKRFSAAIENRKWPWQEFDEATLQRISQGLATQLERLITRKASEERKRARAEKPKRIPREERLCATAFAPLTFGASQQQVAYLALHTQPQLPEVRALIGQQDLEAVQAGPTIGLAANVNQRVLVRVTCLGGRISEPNIWTHWKLQSVILPFVIQVDDAPPPMLILIFSLSVDEAVVGSIVVRRPTEAQGSGSRRPTYERSMTALESVFISYSRVDMAKVTPVVATYVRLGVKTFFDQSTIVPGEEWRSQLFAEISKSELFHLFWSQSASDSTWVVDEAKHALSMQKSSKVRPKIFISMLEGPPWPPHPSELDDLQFNDFYRAAAAGYSRG